MELATEADVSSHRGPDECPFASLWVRWTVIEPASNEQETGRAATEFPGSFLSDTSIWKSVSVQPWCSYRAAVASPWLVTGLADRTHFCRRRWPRPCKESTVPIRTVLGKFSLIALLKAATSCL